MPASPWTLAGDKAILKRPGISAELDLKRPGLGLHNLKVAGQCWEAARLLGVTWGDASDQPHAVSDGYVRGEDLIATYAEEARRPFAPQVYWRVGNPPPPADGGAGLQIELLVSVQTQVLDAEPRMTALSAVRASEFLYLEDEAAGRFAALEPGTDLPPSAACLLVRLADSPLSYVEMVHPRDFNPGHLSVAQSGENWTIRHTLIACRMEKGVIIRVRLRGGIVPRSRDVDAAAGLYEAFSHAALPLSA